MVASYNGLFAAEFQVHTLVQVFFVIQCIWTGVMGLLVTYDPTLSPINTTSRCSARAAQRVARRQSS